MKTTLLALILATAQANAENSPGHAKAEWIAESTTVRLGKIRTVVKFTIDEGWHIYWLNPGEAGMPLSVKWNLPEGWSAGEILHPAPIRFTTGELAGFGYEGSVLLPIDLIPPADLKEPATLSGKLSWLACNDSSCIPGSAEISLRIDGQKEDPDAPEKRILVDRAYESLPREVPGSTLAVEDAGESWKLTLTLPADALQDLSTCEVFALPANFIDPTAKPVFKKQDGKWIATAAKSPYFTGEIPPLTLVLAAPGQAALRFTTGP